MRGIVKIYFKDANAEYSVKSIRRVMRLCHKYIIPYCFSYDNEKEKSVGKKNYLEIIIPVKKGVFNTREWQYRHIYLKFRSLSKSIEQFTNRTIEYFIYKFIKKYEEV